MISGAECTSCAFWLLQPTIGQRDNVRVGQCRRHAPRVTQGADAKCHASFPLMREHEWCGDHAVVEVPVDA